MTETASAFRASYADWKLIKTRSVIQIVLEVPIEQADRAYQVLGGMPAPGAETWCAIARLNGEASATPFAAPVEAAGSCGESPDRPHSPRKVAADKRLAQRAGRLCSDPVFQQFLLERQHISSKNEPEAAEFIRRYCGVESRSELLPGEPAGMVWTSLHSEFEAWRMI